MNPNFRIALRLLVLVPALLSLGMAKKKDEVTVRFFTEANAQDTERFAAPVILHNPPRQAFIRRIPEISERDVLAIFPFPAPDGSFGCAFKLDDHGRIALNATSTERRGSALVAFVNARQVIDMQIDRVINDGIVTIQAGLTAPEIDLLRKKFRVLGDTGKSNVKRRATIDD